MNYYHLYCSIIRIPKFYCIAEPTYNVATTCESATVVEGVSRSRNALLDGNTKTYDWNYGYTCHQIGSGNILVQLGQPYLVDSMRYILSILNNLYIDHPD